MESSIHAFILAAAATCCRHPSPIRGSTPATSRGASINGSRSDVRVRDGGSMSTMPTEALSDGSPPDSGVRARDEVSSEPGDPSQPWSFDIPVRTSEPTRVVADFCAPMDLDYQRAPLFRVRGAPDEIVQLRASVPGVRRSRWAREPRRGISAAALVLGSVEVHGWRCIYAADPRGLFTGFIEATRLERVPDPADAGADALVGDWFEGESPATLDGIPPDHVRITRAPSGELHLRGEAFWGGAGGYDLRRGDYDGPIHVANGFASGHDDESGCALRLVLRGPFLMVDDNSQCGGMNVRFWGIYVRAADPIAFGAD